MTTHPLHPALADQLPREGWHAAEAEEFGDEVRQWVWIASLDGWDLLRARLRARLSAERSTDGPRLWD